MRAYGQIQCSFWTDPDIQGLSDQARALACYLLTGPHSNGLGCYRLPDGYIQADFGWTPQTVSKAFVELFQIGFCNRCETTNFVLIPKFMKWNPTSNPKIASAREKEFNAVPSKCAVYQQLAQCMVDYGLHWSEPFANRIETVSKQEQERKGTEPNKNTPDGAGAPKSAPADRFGDFWEAYPKKRGKKKAREKWKQKKLDAVADSIIADVKTRITDDDEWRRGFIPNPETYINGERWEDELAAPRGPAWAGSKVWDEVLVVASRGSADRQRFVDEHPEYRDALNAAGGLKQIGLMNEWQQKEARERFNAAMEGA